MNRNPQTLAGSNSRAALRTPGRVFGWWTCVLVSMMFWVCCPSIAFGDDATELDAASETSLELSIQLQERLARLNDQWLVWNSAFLQNNRSAAEAATRELQVTVQDLGMKSLPDLANGMIARAVDAAREGDPGKAAWALDMAETMRPGRPETALAGARIAFLAGSYPKAAEQWMRSFYLMFLDPLLRFLWLNNALIWLGCAFILAGVGYVAVQFAAKGGRICRDLARRIPLIPAPLAFIPVMVFLCWPFVLENGWIWVFLLWGALLWNYFENSERWALGLVCLVFALFPVVMLHQHRSVQVAVTEQMRAVDAVAEGSLYGHLFTDMERLRKTLPESTAVTHLIADTNEILGQDQASRPIYMELAENEPNNSAVYNNLGVYHTRRGEHFKAIRFYEQATQADATDILGFYNLSQSYRELLEFDEADRNLQRARDLDPGLVAAWVNDSRPVQSPRAGLQRRGEIRKELKAWLSQGSSPLDELVKNAATAPMALLVPILGLLLARFLGGPLGKQHDSGLSIFDRMIRWLVPGLHGAENGQGFRVLLSLLVLCLILTAPLISVIGYRMPLGYDVGSKFAWIVAGALVVVFYGIRLPHLLRR
jgi:tetratricopeptide (TPR) repeat protein